MDPVACYRDAMQHLAEGNPEECFYSIGDLIQWIEKQGEIPAFLPQVRSDAVAALMVLRRAIKAKYT